MRQLCTLFTGQAGVQMASAVWELLCLEHGVSRNGFIDYDASPQEHLELNSVFEEISPQEKFVPRTVIADLEPSVLDEVRQGIYRELFNPDNLHSYVEDASSNFARGYYTLGAKLVGVLTNSLRSLIEKCDNFDGIMTFSALGGGTGSGLLSLFHERASIEFAGERMVQFSIIPSDKMAVGPVEIYNCVHHLNHSSDFCDLSILLDNSALFDICTKELQVIRPTYTTVNRVVAPLVAGMTASVRFRCNLHGSLTEYLTNLVPFPSIHYPLVTFVPFCTNTAAERSSFTTSLLTRMVFQPDFGTITARLDKGLTLAACLTYRGQHSVSEILSTLSEIRRGTDNLVDWCPTAFKVAYTPQPPVVIPGMGPDIMTKSLSMITNNTCIAGVFERLEKWFMKLFSRRAFLHWYVGEGMEMEEFTDAVEKVRSIASDIRTLEAESMDLMRSRKMGDHTDGQEDMIHGDVDDKSQKIAKPRRLLKREVGYQNSNSVSPCLLMSNQNCPIMEEGQTQNESESQDYAVEI